MEKINTVVAVYDTHSHAEEAIGAFKSSGFDMKKLSIVGKDYETALKADHFVVVAHGTPDEVATAKRILEKTNPLSVDEHRASATG